MISRLCLLASLLALTLAGCGDRGIPVTGSVSYKGQPLSLGTIAFEPQSTEAGAGAVVPIKEGQFSVGEEKKLTSGNYVVRISSADLGSGMDLKTAPPQFQPYETTLELKADTGPLTFSVPTK